jgi:hypothetical protein
MLALNMRTYIKSIMTGVLGTAAWLVVGTGNAQPQDRPQPGNFDPQQMRQRMTEDMRKQFEVKEEAEWKAISERINKVMEARRNVGAGGGPRGFGGPGGPGGQGGPGGASRQGGPGGPEGFGPPPGDAQGAPGQAPGDSSRSGGMRNNAGGPGGPGGFGREANPELEALRKAIESNAPASEIKSKLAALRAARKAKEAELEKAQEDLRQILSARQEAVAVTLGLLK